jgi:two-component system cell cycle sensor histidine kinase/response regulator CckA
MKTNDPYRNLIDNCKELIQSVDTDGRFIFVNLAWSETMGYSEDEWKGMRFQDILAAESREECMNVFTDVLTKGTAQKMSAVFITRSDEALKVSGTAVPRFEEGKVVGIQSVLSDVTRQTEHERSVRSAEYRFSSLFDTMKQGVVYQRPGGEIFLANPAAGHILGLSTDQLLGRSSIDPRWHAVRPDGSPFPDAEHPAIIAGREGRVVQNIEMGIYIPAIESYRWIMVTSIPEVHDGETVPFQVYTTFVDITEQKTAQEQLRIRVELEKVLNTISARFITTTALTFDRDVDLMLTMVGTVMNVDRSYIFRYNDTMEFVENTHEWCKEGIEPQIENLKETPVTLFPQWDIRMRNNEYVYIDSVQDLPPDWHNEKEILEPQGIQSIVVVPLFFTGKALGFVGFDAVSRLIQWSDEDISILRTMSEIVASTIERMRREKALREQTILLQEQAALLDQASDYIMVARHTGELTYANISAREALNVTSDDIGVKQLKGLMLFKDEQYRIIEASLLQKHSWSGEIMFANPNGKDRPCQCSLTMMVDEQGGPSTVLAICSDVSERKEIERSLMRAQRMETVGTLAGGIAHDLNNILGPIMVGIEMLKLDAGDERSLKLLQTMESSAHRGARIVKQVLAFGRGMTTERILVSPKHIAREINDMMRETFPKNIQIHTDIAKNIRNANADPTQMHQVLLNLTVNARDAMPRGGNIKVTAENFDIDASFAQLHKDVKPGAYIRFSVDDTGPGIAPDLMDRIFEPFFTTKEVGKGTGLGLSTVQSIVQSHDGFIDVYSELGTGTSFKVYIPALLTESESDIPVRIEDEYPLGNKETILVVDDEASVREIAASTLQSFNYEVLVASDGAEGLAVYSENKERIDIILSDMMMPFLDGPSMIRALKKIDNRVRVIGMSGLKTEDKEKLAIELGVKHFIEKPYTANTLLKVLRQALNTDSGE